MLICLGIETVVLVEQHLPINKEVGMEVGNGLIITVLGSKSQRVIRR